MKYINAFALLAILLASACGAAPTTPAATVSPQRLKTYPTLGPANAPVLITEYGDFGCPTCKGWFHSGTLAQLQQAYGDKIAFIWRDLPIITPQSPKAAEAGQCAFDQNKFWEYHDYLYDKAPGISVSELKQAAVTVGLDAGSFNQCLDSGKYAAMVAQSKQAGTDLGFLGTPGFTVNEFRLAGPASLAQFKAVIDPILAGK